MKKIIAYVPVWLLYYIGDLISNTLAWEYFLWVFVFYQWCMITSMELQDWAGLEDPWHYPEEKEIGIN